VRLELEKLRAIVKRIEPTMQCNCDLDKWEPERSTQHSFVCRIHVAATEEYLRGTKT
jgi:hypothetical protein